jgi:hypothetical protein
VFFIKDVGVELEEISTHHIEGKVTPDYKLFSVHDILIRSYWGVRNQRGKWGNYGSFVFIYCLLLLISLWLWQELDHVAYNGRIIDEWRIGKDSEGSGGGLIEVISRYLLGSIKETTESLSQGSWCPNLNSNQGPLENKSSALPLYQTTRFVTF